MLAIREGMVSSGVSTRRRGCYLSREHTRTWWWTRNQEKDEGAFIVTACDYSNLLLTQHRRQLCARPPHLAPAPHHRQSHALAITKGGRERVPPECPVQDVPPVFREQNEAFDAPHRVLREQLEHGVQRLFRERTRRVNAFGIGLSDMCVLVNLYSQSADGDGLDLVMVAVLDWFVVC